jgi:hypothetical protein
VFFFVYPFNLAGNVGVDFRASLVSILNIAAFITALISFRQLLFPARIDDDSEEYNRIPFHVFNIFFVSVYFIVSSAFLVHNKQFYTGYETLTDIAAIKKYYLSSGFSSIGQIFIASSVVVNLIYILTHLVDFYGGNVNAGRITRRLNRI